MTGGKINGTREKRKRERNKNTIRGTKKFRFFRDEKSPIKNSKNSNKFVRTFCFYNRKKYNKIKKILYSKR